MAGNGSPPGFPELSAMVTRYHRPGGELGKERQGGGAAWGERDEKLGQIFLPFKADRVWADRVDQKYKILVDRFVLIAVKRDIQNIGVLKLLATRTGGTLRKNLRKLSENLGSIWRNQI